MDDQQIIDQINTLASEEHILFNRESEGKVTPEERERLRRIEVTLDQAWDLLHQRRARREAGLRRNCNTGRSNRRYVIWRRISHRTLRRIWRRILLHTSRHIWTWSRRLCC